MFNKNETSRSFASSIKKDKSFFQQSISLTVIALLVLQNLFAALPAAAQQSRDALSPQISNTIVISQFQVAGGTAGDEFVELHNISANPVDLNGHRVVYRSAAGTTDATVLATWTASTIIPAGKYYLITNSAAYDDTTVVADSSFSGGSTGALAGAGGGIALRNGASNTGTIIDSVGYGTATNAFVETTVTSAPASNASKARNASGCTDTDNNSADFSTVTPSTPRNSGTTAIICGSGNTNPSGSGAANPSTVTAGGTTLLSVTVTQGTNPSSSITAVSGNLTSIGGSATQTFFNDGTNGDVTAGDNIFSYNATVDGATVAGSKTLPVTITDALGRMGSASIALTVTSTSTAISATGSANPNSLPPGSQTLLTVAVTSGTNPASSGIAVTGNLSTIGGSAAQTFYDDATNGDSTAGDNIFSYRATIASGTATGAKSLPVTVTDAQSRTANTTISLTVTVPPQVTTAQPLPFSQNWSNINLITSNGDWNNVPGIIGYRGDDLTTATGTDPQTILADGSGTPVDITANQTNPNTYTSGGLVEFELTDPVVAFQGSTTSDAPNMVINLDTTGQNNITVSYNLRDIDGSADNAIQPVALQYRIGNTGNYTNVPAAYVADATTGPNLATLVTSVNVALPAAVSNQSLVQLRIITTNAVGTDEFVGIDDINIVSGGTVPLSGSGSANSAQVQSGGSLLLKVTVNPATNPSSTGITVTGDLTSIGGSGTQTFYDDGTNGDTTAGDNVFSYMAAVPANSSGGTRSIPVTIRDAESRTASTSITFTVIAASDPQEHLVMGNPSGATADVNQPFNYLLAKPQYVMSYHRDRAIPNWVSWHLDSSWIGSAPRQDDFRPDESLPADWYRVQSTDYSGSGFDRGHHTPSADRTRSIPDNSATFLMTNMMPQAPGNNQGPWEKLESESRAIVGQGNELYIIGGSVGVGGTGSAGGVTNTLAGGKITVPSYTWKVILILPVGDNDVARVNNNTRTIAVIMPNTDAIRPDAWQKYLATVDQVEQLTGYDFFSNVPANIQSVIESRLDPASNTAPQTVPGGTYTDLNITAPNTSLTGDVTVTGTLTLGGSTLTTGVNKLILGPGAVVSRNSGFVNGTVEKQFNTASGSFEYPVGTQNGYSPVTVNLTALGQNPSSLAVKAVQSAEPNLANPAAALQRYWTLTETGDLTAKLTFRYLDADVPSGASEGNYRLQRYEGSFAEIPASIDTTANTAATTNGISNFSNWTLAAPLAPTAVAVTVGGRIRTETGRGISRAAVTMTDSSGNVQTTYSTTFGYYRFRDVPAGDTYVLTVKGKRYNFSQPSQVVNINEDTLGINFTGYMR